MKINKRAFTFVELLVAITIFSIIAASLYYTLGSGIRVYRRGNILIRDNQRLRVFFDTISTDLRNAVPFNEEFNKKNKPTPFRKLTSFNIEWVWLSDKVSFPTLVNVYEEGIITQKLAKVSYYFEEKKRGGNRLIRKLAGDSVGFDEEAQEEESLLQGLEDFSFEDLSFEYAYKIMDEYEWRREDEFEDGIPKGVRINLTLKNRENKNEEVFVKTVFVPRGKLGSDAE